VIIGWLYNRSRGSTLVAGIAHAAANTAITFCPNRWWPAYTSTLALGALAVILADRMWVKLPPDDSGEHPAVYREPALNDR
jgi:membrane protease YdiL (CAAX protease family)